MSDPGQCLHLLTLAEGWRAKAERIREKYVKQNPNLVAHVITALETCAEELEEEVRKAPSAPLPPSPSAPLPPRPSAPLPPRPSAPLPPRPSAP